jgi:hypothetical protein
MKRPRSHPPEHVHSASGGLRPLMDGDDSGSSRRSLWTRLRNRIQEPNLADQVAEGLRQHLREKEAQRRAEEAREAREAARGR